MKAINASVHKMCKNMGDSERLFPQSYLVQVSRFKDEITEVQRATALGDTLYWWPRRAFPRAPASKLSQVK